MNPDFVPLHIALGNARANLGAREAALASYRRALELDPGNANAVLSSGADLEGRRGSGRAGHGGGVPRRRGGRQAGA